MKHRITRSIALVAACGLCGCMTNSSPVTPAPQADTTGFGTAAALAGSTALGGAAGYELGGKGVAGAAVGAAAGLVGGVIVDNVVKSHDAQKDAELVEAARRAERAKIMDEYWLADRLPKASSDQSAPPSAALVNYPGGYFEGINLAPRSAGSAAPVDEPQR